MSTIKVTLSNNYWYGRDRRCSTQDINESLLSFFYLTFFFLVTNFLKNDKASSFSTTNTIITLYYRMIYSNTILIVCIKRIFFLPYSTGTSFFLSFFVSIFHFHSTISSYVAFHRKILLILSGIVGSCHHYDDGFFRYAIKLF